MTPDSIAATVFVETPARLHFGLLDLGGTLGRMFGGIGTAAPAPTLLVSACRADEVVVAGDETGRAEEYARRFLSRDAVAKHHTRHGARICVHRALPPHAGLGSGTQLALAVARALAELYGQPTDAPGLAQAVGRARRSAIGTWIFAGGGLVLEGGRRSAGECVAPLLARLPFPASWRGVVTVPDSAAGMNGHAEEAAFAQLPPPQAEDAERLAHTVLMALLPALVEADLPTFGSALTAIQAINGRWFAPVQGGTFAPGPSEELVRRMAELGAAGVGQSSWGPTVYGIVEGEHAASRLADQMRAILSTLGVAGRVYEGPFRAEGARVWHEPDAAHDFLTG
jgi:beta-ribofuranosylaminobenzene 5'-phosphate synthase